MSDNRRKPTKQIAPRLADGRSRIPYGGRLPGSIKSGLKAIARIENKSVSWVMEEVIIQFFKLKRPKYVEAKRTASVIPFSRRA